MSIFSSLIACLYDDWRDMSYNRTIGTEAAFAFDCHTVWLHSAKPFKYING